MLLDYKPQHPWPLAKLAGGETTSGRLQVPCCNKSMVEWKLPSLPVLTRCTDANVSMLHPHSSPFPIWEWHKLHMGAMQSKITELLHVWNNTRGMIVCIDSKHRRISSRSTKFYNTFCFTKTTKHSAVIKCITDVFKVFLQILFFVLWIWYYCCWGLLPNFCNATAM